MGHTPTKESAPKVLPWLVCLAAWWAVPYAGTVKHHQLTGTPGGFTINGKPLSAQCSTLDATVAHLRGGPPGARHPDIRVRPTDIVLPAATDI